jgi:hypothetical protein
MGVLEIPWNPSRRQLRQFAWLLGGCLLLLAAIVYARSGTTTPTVILAVGGLAAGGLVAGMLGMVYPQALRWVFVAWMVAVFPIGWLVSHTALAVMYYAVLTPIGWLLRLFGHDPMQRKSEAGTQTYWKPRSEPEDVERYFKQY